MKTDIIVIGAGACGMVASIIAAQRGKKVLLLEKLPKVGAKVRASGGGKCNLTNTLNKDEFMHRFGKQGQFMRDALNFFDNGSVRDFFSSIGVETVSKDGFRVFPAGHNSATVLNALSAELERLGVKVIVNCSVNSLISENSTIKGVNSTQGQFIASKVIIATGGMGYPTLGSSGDGYKLAKELGHSVKELHPAMMPLKTKESWVANCRADTVAKVTMRVAIKKYKKLKAVGDLIFTKDGIRGPVVLDFSRELTPILGKFKEVPIVVNLTKNLHFDEILKEFKKYENSKLSLSTIEVVSKLLPSSIAKEIVTLSQAEPNLPFSKQDGIKKDRLIKLLVETPLTIIGHNGFDMAMVTRGGISLKEIDPKSLQSKIIEGLHFCGEVVDLDGPCGGFNLQWAFSSGALAGSI